VNNVISSLLKWFAEAKLAPQEGFCSMDLTSA